eukprot:12219_3
MRASLFFNAFINGFFFNFKRAKERVESNTIVINHIKYGAGYRIASISSRLGSSVFRSSSRGRLGRYQSGGTLSFTSSF